MGKERGNARDGREINAEFCPQNLKEETTWENEARRKV
jgi:hypothetical protein